MGETQLSTVVVTGGAGFIGSHLVDKLVQRGNKVIVIDNLSTGRVQNIGHHLGKEQFHFIEADVCEGLFAPLSQVLHGTGRLDAIVHLAAQTSVLRSMQAPLGDARINHLGLLQTLEFARYASPKKFIYASSAAVYGDKSSITLKETDEASPQSPYGVHKLAGEYMLKIYASASEMSWTVLRFFNVYGPRQDPQNPYSGVVSTFVHQALKGDRYLTIHGDGHQSRDFIYVEDVAWSMISICEARSVQVGVYNIGTGKETSILNLAQNIVKLVGSRAELRHVCRSRGDLCRSVADISSAAEMLGLRTPTSLEVGLEKTVDQMRSARLTARTLHD